MFTAKHLPTGHPGTVIVFFLTLLFFDVYWVYDIKMPLIKNMYERYSSHACM